jgi:hypothetical protein
VLEVADIFREYGPQYREKFGERMPANHLKVMGAIERCRTEVLGGQIYYCEHCAESHYSYHSCQNRHCPKCQNERAEQWLAWQQDLLLPVNYFMVTFTLPADLRRVARSNQRVVYDILFRSSAAALQKLALDPRFVGGQIGLVGVLHTWKRDQSYHPHTHYLVPGGGLSADGEKWLPARTNFLVHVKPLSKLFRAKFRDELKMTELFEQVPAEVWQKEWVVHSKAVNNGQAALKYLAPYIFRVAISNSRIVKVEDGQVTFRYKKHKSGKTKYLTLPAEEFIRRFLQHVLPKGFIKVRYYGLFSPGKRPLLKQARQLLAVSETAIPDQESEPAVEPEQSQEAIDRPQAGLPCPTCGRSMHLVGRLKPKSERSPP